MMATSANERATYLVSALLSQLTDGTYLSKVPRPMYDRVRITSGARATVLYEAGKPLAVFAISSSGFAGLEIEISETTREFAEGSARVVFPSLIDALIRGVRKTVSLRPTYYVAMPEEGDFALGIPVKDAVLYYALTLDAFPGSITAGVVNDLAGILDWLAELKGSDPEEYERLLKSPTPMTLFLASMVSATKKPSAVADELAKLFSQNVQAFKVLTKGKRKEVLKDLASSLKSITALAKQLKSANSQMPPDVQRLVSMQKLSVKMEGVKGSVVSSALLASMLRTEVPYVLAFFLSHEALHFTRPGDFYKIDDTTVWRLGLPNRPPQNLTPEEFAELVAQYANQIQNMLADLYINSYLLNVFAPPHWPAFMGVIGVTPATVAQYLKVKDVKAVATLDLLRKGGFFIDLYARAEDKSFVGYIHHVLSRYASVTADEVADAIKELASRVEHGREDLFNGDGLYPVIALTVLVHLLEYKISALAVALTADILREKESIKVPVPLDQIVISGGSGSCSRSGDSPVVVVGQKPGESRNDKGEEEEKGKGSGNGQGRDSDSEDETGGAGADGEKQESGQQEGQETGGGAGQGNKEQEEQESQRGSGGGDDGREQKGGEEGGEEGGKPLETPMSTIANAPAYDRIKEQTAEANSEPDSHSRLPGRGSVVYPYKFQRVKTVPMHTLIRELVSPALRRPVPFVLMKRNTRRSRILATVALRRTGNAILPYFSVFKEKTHTLTVFHALLDTSGSMWGEISRGYLPGFLQAVAEAYRDYGEWEENPVFLSFTTFTDGISRGTAVVDVRHIVENSDRIREIAGTITGGISAGTGGTFLSPEDIDTIMLRTTTGVLALLSVQEGAQDDILVFDGEPIGKVMALDADEPFGVVIEEPTGIYTGVEVVASEVFHGSLFVLTDGYIGSGGRNYHTLHRGLTVWMAPYSDTDFSSEGAMETLETLYGSIASQNRGLLGAYYGVFRSGVPFGVVRHVKGEVLEDAVARLRALYEDWHADVYFSSREEFPELAMELHPEWFVAENLPPELEVGLGSWL